MKHLDSYELHELCIKNDWSLAEQLNNMKNSLTVTKKGLQLPNFQLLFGFAPTTFRKMNFIANFWAQ